MADKSRLRRTISRWANSGEQDQADLRKAHAGTGSLAINEAGERQRVEIRGALRTVTLRPRGGVPALEAELEDGTGSLTLIWLGRRSIQGIQPGRALKVLGRTGRQDGRLVIFNPRYELLP